MSHSVSQNISKLWILDVAHGNSAVLQDEDGVTIIDAGRYNALQDFLEEQRIQKIDVLLISHADTDHIEGLIGLITCKKFDIGIVRLNPDGTKDTSAFERLAVAIETSYGLGKIDYRPSLTVRDNGEFDRGELQVQVLAPGVGLATKGVGGRDSNKRKITSNSLSVVIKVVYGKKSVALFPGDIDQVGLDNLQGLNKDIRAPILIFPHHGGLPNSGDPHNFAQQICSLVEPESIIFSIGRGSHGTPRPKIVAAVRSCTPARLACTQLSKHCMVREQRRSPLHLNPVFAKGKEKKRCCAGSMLIDLNEVGGIFSPPPINHQSFINNNTETPLCKIRMDQLNYIASIPDDSSDDDAPEF